ncbi:MAG TPA: hypothetical protein VKY82_03215 [Flavobacterium sp.]|nr:hypothetical protein [Flavobacterium sp.]
MLLCGGIIALTSCSDSIYQEIDEQNNEMNAPPTFNNEDPGHAHGDSGDSGLIRMGNNYASPWDIWFRPDPLFQPNYIVQNGHGDRGSNYDLEIFAYIGLAYFDGIDNGTYTDLKTGATFNLASGNYPNLYPPSNPHEVGNLVKTVVPLTSQAYPAATSGFRLEDEESHLLLPGIPGVTEKNRYPWLSQGQIFDFAGTITPQEVELLRTYGKVFFYEVNVYDKITNAPVLLGQIMHPEIQTLPTGPLPNADWKHVTDMSSNVVQGHIPPLGDFDLYYYYANLPNGTVWDMYYIINEIPGFNRCDSREVVFDIPHSWKLYEVPIPGSTSSKLLLEIWQNSQWLWRNASLRLAVEN